MTKFRSTCLLVLMALSFQCFGSAYAFNTQTMPSPDTAQNLFIYHLQLAPAYENPEKWTEETYKIIQVHAEFLEELGRQGILAFAGRTLFNPGHPDLFGIAVIKADSLEEAQEIMKDDPAVVHGIQQAAIFPFSMGIRYLENLK